ncbi:MAG TPA: prolipoprotein diacylglyceryl transferase family protein [Puia sp.]|jgi:phosphatidylglycerol:prolipoprotein diacylglycerol transferase|nr:prolipoprotein diacylglyceryl transferase family protein [Puia sp.]
MYPNLYFAFKDLFNVDWGFLRFVNSFGFFVALSFIGGAIVLSKELSRKERDGLLVSEEEKIIVGKPPSGAELLINFLIGFLLGYKLIGLFISNSSGDVDPRQYIFSLQGNLWAGLVIGLLVSGLKYWEKNKNKLPEPEERTIRIWPHDRVGDLTIFAAVFGFLGAKIFDILESPSDFINSLKDLHRGTQDFASLIFSGLTFYGGLICAALAIWYYAKKHHIGFWQLNDSAAPGLMLAYAIGRIGCQVSGDGDWGIENAHPKPFGWLPDWMWSYHYPHNVISKGINIPGCLDAQYCNQLPVGVFPTPFYETVICLILFIIIWSFRKKFTVPGTLFAFYLIVNGIERFFIEKIRVNVKYDIFGMHPTQAEIISFALVVIGIILWIVLKKKSEVRSQKLGV